MVQGIRVHLSGRFGVDDADGNDLTPRSSKAQGLVALLATHPKLERSRVWLQDKLWSDRGREQGGASLRQALAEIRRGVGAHEGALRSDRRLVSLDPARVEVLREATGEFLEGIDVRDPEFDSWLRMNRAGAADPETHGRRAARREAGYVVRIGPRAGGTEMERLLSEVFLGRVATSLSEQLGIPVAASGNARAARPITLSARSVLRDGTFTLHATCLTGTSQHQVWAGARLLPGRGAAPLDDDAILQMTSEAVSVIANAVTVGAPAHRDGTGDPGLLTARAVKGIFSLRRDSLAEADALLATAHEMSHRGNFLAWRVFLRVVGLLERHIADPKAAVDEIEALSAQALELEPMNSFVLAIVAYGKLVITGEVAEGAEMARRAASLNDANPFAWLALSTASLYVGKVAEAHRCMLRARNIGNLSPYRFWWDTGLVLTATATGEFDGALRLARSANAVAGEFRPPLRYMIALYLRAGDFDRAIEAIRQLRKLEPEFVPEQLIEDPAYPAATLRRAQAVSSTLLRGLL